MRAETIQDANNTELQREKAIKVLLKAKEMENKKINHKFVKIDKNTRVYKKMTNII